MEHNAASRYLNKIANASQDDAQAYERSDEQYLFCIDYLEISAHNANADELVNILEDHFEEILDEREAAIAAAYPHA